MKYRKEIDGLRAVAIIPVLLFHLGVLPNGYLGVDVFFTISGYLITRIVYQGYITGKLSIRAFYLKRVARIIPVVSLVSLTVLILGYQCMLPDDLENMAQSVFATSVFSNNILQLITTRDYWDVINEYKPLLHTWSLGVEEQYYLLYPVLLVLTTRIKRLTFLSSLVFLTVLSLLLYIYYPTDDYTKFYLLPFRFFQIGIGGIFALLRVKMRPIIVSFSLFLLILVLFLKHGIPANMASVTVSALSVIVVANENIKYLGKSLLTNNLAVKIGLISFSLYMWHQPIIAFYRYINGASHDIFMVVAVVLIFFVVAVLSYQYVERPCRKWIVKFPYRSIPALIIINSLIILLSLSIYSRKGVVRDVPILGRIANVDNIISSHGEYNERVRSWKVDRSKIGKQILVLGNSYARDFANILFEKHGSSVDISYVAVDLTNSFSVDSVRKYLPQANVIFIENAEHAVYGGLSQKIFCIGPKNFGENNGRIWNQYRLGVQIDSISISQRFYITNEKQKSLWGEQYVDLLTPLYRNGKIRCVDYDGYLLSEDCRHLTHKGALFYAEKIASELEQIIES